MALEKDKERPTSPKPRKLGFAMTPQAHQAVNSDSNSNFAYKTYDNKETENLINEQSRYSPGPMGVAGRKPEGSGHKNILLSPGGQLNDMNPTVLRREDSTSLLSFSFLSQFRRWG